MKRKLIAFFIFAILCMSSFLLIFVFLPQITNKKTLQDWSIYVIAREKKKAA